LGWLFDALGWLFATEWSKSWLQDLGLRVRAKKVSRGSLARHNESLEWGEFLRLLD
jgi:hypothetical protein